MVRHISGDGHSFNAGDTSLTYRKSEQRCENWSDVSHSVGLSEDSSSSVPKLQLSDQQFTDNYESQKQNQDQIFG